MSDFDELFNSVENTEIVTDMMNDGVFSKLRSGVVEALARDSKIKLVTPYDKVRPLDTGAYWYDSVENTLYVGAGDFQTVVNVLDFLSHASNIVYIPAPRIKSRVDFEQPIITQFSSIIYIPTPRIKTKHTVEKVYETNKIINVKKTTLNKVNSNVGVELSDIKHESEVQIIYG